MKILLRGKDFADESCPVRERIVETFPEENILTLCSKIGNMGIAVSFPKYYTACWEMMFSDDSLPYVIKDSKVCWNVPYDEVTVRDFLDTHDLDGELEYEYNFPCAGGVGFVDVLEQIAIWAPNIWEIAVTIGEAYGFFKTAQSFVEWIRRKYPKKEKMPYPTSFSEFIYRRELWNHHELSTLLDISPEDARQFLKVYGYRWDNSKKLYVQDPEKKARLLELEGSIQVLDL